MLKHRLRFPNNTGRQVLPETENTIPVGISLAKLSLNTSRGQGKTLDGPPELRERDEAIAIPAAGLKICFIGLESWSFSCWV